MKKQKDTFLLICSFLLIAACLFSLFAGVKGFNDFKAIEEYKTQEKTEGLANIDTGIDGINQLKENEETYLNGYGTYTAGLASYAAGQQALAEGAAKLNAGEAQYKAGQQTLADGKAQYAAGKEKLDANTDAYNEGKQKLALAEGLVGINDALGMNDPLGLKDQITDGKAQLKEYEDGQQQLSEAATSISAGEAQLSAAGTQLKKGYADYQAGQSALASGAAQLADGKQQLSVFEEGENQVAAGMMTLLQTGPIYRHDGTTIAVEGVASRLGLSDDPTTEEMEAAIYAKNDDGSVKVVNGVNYLNFDNCMKICKAGQQFIADQTDDVTAELMSRVILYMVMFLTSLLGAIAGIKGADAAYAPRRLEGTTFMGMIVAILAIGANVYGLISHYAGYTYPLEDGSYSGNLQFIAAITIAAAAILFAVAAYSSLTAYKKGLADGTISPDGPTDGEIPDTALDDGAVPQAVNAETPAAEEMPADTTAPAAPAEDAEAANKLHKLESQEAELKEMLASLSSKINDIKQQTV